MNQSHEHVLVTGGAGFIGSHVCEALLARGASVVVLDDFNDYYDPRIKRGNIAGFQDRVEVVEGDLRDKELVVRVFAAHRFTAVFHLAARAGVRPSIVDPELYVSTNVNGTLHLLEACREHGVRKFVFASSSSVYGVNPKVPFAEEDPLIRTISPYAATKLAGEQLCSTYSYLHGIRCVCLRFFTVFGPRQRPDLAISKFMSRILAGQPIDQYGDGSTARDYTYVSDIVKGVLAAADYEAADFEIFNLGGSDPHTLAELITGVEEITGLKAAINLLPDQPGDVPRTFADVSKARKLLGYEPSVDLRTGLEAYLRWLRGQAG